MQAMLGFLTASGFSRKKKEFPNQAMLCQLLQKEISDLFILAINLMLPQEIHVTKQNHYCSIQLHTV